MEEERIEKSFSLNPEIARKLEETAKLMGISESEVLERAWEVYLKEQKGE